MSETTTMKTKRHPNPEWSPDKLESILSLTGRVAELIEDLETVVRNSDTPEGPGYDASDRWLIDGFVRDGLLDMEIMVKALVAMRIRINAGASSEDHHLLRAFAFDDV